LLPAATLDPPAAVQAQALARRLVEALRAKGTRGTVEGLIREYALSSQEGVALMCLAEALLRIPDIPTRDALIRDKIGTGDWHAHLGQSPSLFVNAATWGLVVTGKLVATSSEAGLSAALTRLIARGGEPVIRRGVDMAMRMMGEQFVTGQTIDEALANSRHMEARGFRYSYDMLGEAATTADDAARYYRDYEQAIHAIGRASAGRGIVEGPGISVKLSALHPRYTRLQRGRVMTELLPRLVALTRLAREYDIGLNIDAEEADRLDLSLDLLEALCFDPSLAGWNGIGFVVQAYQKRAPFVLDAVIDLARRSGHRLMLRLVKGAYWDTEIKRAQVDGPHAGRHMQHGRRGFPAGRLRIPVPARHGRAVIRGGRRLQPAEPAVPHLCAGGHARNLVGLSRAPASGERREHVLRQPHQRSFGAGGRADRRSGCRGRARRAGGRAAPDDRAAAPSVR
jgi:RHH-type proline utilization regulon transcriptional repressor/proline dehydrogenase/delta 1-pyrroline-5-carboxylate dehydrogenase